MSQKLTFIIDRRLNIQVSGVLAKSSVKLTKSINKFLFSAREMCEVSFDVVWPRLAFVNRGKVIL